MNTRNLASLVIAALTASVAIAQPLGTAFTYQGQLKDAGAPLNGTVDVDASLWDASEAGNQIGSTVNLVGVVVVNGGFMVQLDFGAASYNGAARWLQLAVNGTPLTPRQELTAAPNALFALNSATASTAANAELLDGLNSTAFLQSIPFPLTLSGWSASHVIKGDTDSYYDGATGILGIASSPSAVFGYTFGVVGENNGWQGCGVRGKANNSGGPGFGVWGTSASTNGYGVLGQATAGTGFTYGVWGGSASTGGDGVVGQATAASGTTYGVVGEALSTSGRGVFGSAPTTTGFAYGVLGQTAPPHIGYAVFASGDMGASGLKPFRIDHPFDPENKYLLHYASESPSPQNFYSGNTLTDGHGYAWVELPDYFAEVNTNFKYQLTVIGRVFAQVIVTEEIRANRFQIRTSAPRVKVSWRVESDRNDLYVRSKNPKDVVEKMGVEKGTYQHPELYGRPPEMGMGYHPPRELPSPLAVSNAAPATNSPNSEESRTNEGSK